MSIRFRFTLIYNAILALTLAVFGFALYSSQAQSTLEALKKDLVRTSDVFIGSFKRMAENPTGLSPHDTPPPMSFENFSKDKAFQKLQEREIVRVLDAQGHLIASPFGSSDDALPLSTAGLQTLESQYDLWETEPVQDQRMLIYSSPIISRGKLVYILQLARPLTERDRSLEALASSLVLASIITLVAASGIGWFLSKLTLQPIQRITQTAQSIGDERDFSRRVNHTGPQDEVGQLATTFNSMLSRLTDAYQRVAESLEMQRNFVADVSHELRTPLTTLRGNLGLLRRKPAIPAEEQADILNDMVDESDRLIRLVNDLLVLARADAAQNLEKQPFELFPVIDETVRQAHQLDPERKITLQVLPEMAILGDRDAFKQVVLIGLDNAIKHTNGHITITAERKKTQVEIRIQDCGAGIAPEKLAHVFDRFYRGEEAVGIPGFGLGLPIAQSLTEIQGGSIQMESEEGTGSVVILNFPFAQ